MMSTFEKLYAIDCNDHKEGKNGFDYLSWTWAWAEIKKACPDATYNIKRFENNLPYVYDPKTGYMVFTEVTINGLTHEMWLPVMDSANKAMKAESYQYKVKNPNFKYAKQDKDGRWVDKYGKEQPEYLTKNVAAADMFDVNKTIMRCLVKNLAMFGLGLYIYAGEDLPEEIDDETKEVKSDKKQAKPKTTAKKKDPEPEKPKLASKMQIQGIRDLCVKTGKKEEVICPVYNIGSFEELTPEMAAEIFNVLKNYEARQAL